MARAHPFARPLRLRVDGDVDVRAVAPEALGKVGRRALPVALVALAEYRAGATFRPRTVAPGAAVLRLLLNAPAARLKPRAAMAALRPLVERAQVVRGVRGEAREAAQRLLAAMDERIEAGA